MADLLLIPEAAWREAQRRAEVVRLLAERGRGPRHLVRAATASLGLWERQTYTLLRRVVEEGYLSPQKRSAAWVVERVPQRAASAGFDVERTFPWLARLAA